MAQGIADKNIITMLLIFLVAGSFCGRCRTQQCGKRSVFYAVTDSGQICSGGTYLWWHVLCQLAMGTSVGTITLMAPIAAAVSDASGFDLALCVGFCYGRSNVRR